MIFSPVAWFFIIYFSVGALVTMEGIITAWDMYPEYETIVKVISSIIILVCWPLILFVRGNDDD